MITGLTANTGYGFQAGTNDSTAGASTQGTIITASTTTLAANPTITSFRVFTTSISVTLGANGNPAGTTLTLSTGTNGHYAVSNSSKGIVGSSDVTLVISNLSTATVYGFMAGTNDSTANAATQTTIITASTSTLAVSPTVTSYRIFATSASITLGANTNPDGTSVVVSTGTGSHFAIANSSAGIFSSGSATLVITGLTPNTGYGFQGGARDLTAGAATQSVTAVTSTTTLAANPAITSFQIYTTSISVTLGANGNPVGTTLTISTGIGGHYAVSNSSKGIVGSSDVMLVISNLSTATVYGLMAGTNDSAANASTQTTIITASTSTIAVSPTVTSYRIFATSASITLGANSNPDGTAVMVSTGTGGHFAVANSSAGIFSSGSVTLVITGLTANSGYGFQGGARDST
ncbi:MAG: hypothetical protein HYY63_03350, partial [Elusimicrobia bacterium]|nr:hypothetical protein [Elusimicrobiota bacterium]